MLSDTGNITDEIIAHLESIFIWCWKFKSESRCCNDDQNPRIKVKVLNYLSTLIQKRAAYRGIHVGAFNLEFLSQIKQVFSSEETLWLLNLGRNPLITVTKAGFETTLLPSCCFTVINRKPYIVHANHSAKEEINIYAKILGVSCSDDDLGKLNY